MRLVIVLLALLCVVACSAPPQKEIDLAQGAIDAARAAGAEQYASQPFTAATSALQQANEAVSQRDYRLALTLALNAHERAQEAARDAADGQARARSAAEVAIIASASALDQLNVRLKEAEAARVPRRELDPSRSAAKEALTTLQDARKAAAAGNYLKAQERVKDLSATIKAEITKVDAAMAKKPARPVRRSR